MSADREGTPEHPVFAAIAPLLTVVGADVIEPASIEAGDIPIRWEGSVVGGIRLGSLSEALDRLVGHIEAEFGSPLSDLGRIEKQNAIRMLDERGAFLLRRSIDIVADRMGVSRITVYNYLTHAREEAK